MFGKASNPVSSFCKRLNSYLYILWNITYRCNLNCKHCMVADERKIAVKELNDGDTIRLLANVCLNDAIKIKEFNFQGGEPLVAPNFTFAVKWLGEHHIPWTINTNGTLWNDQHFDLITKYPPREIVVSLDGDPETHDWLRGPGVFSKLQETIKIIHDVNNNIQVNAICVLHKQNVKNIVTVFETAAHLGIKQLVLSKLAVSGNAVVNRDLLEPEPLDLFNVLRTVAYLKGRFEDTDLFVQWVTPLMLAYFNLPIAYSGCPAIRSEVTISPDSELQPCSNALVRLQRRFGEELCLIRENVSLLNNDFESIRTSPLFQRIYELLHGPLSPPRHARCLDCYYVEICQTCPSDRWIGKDEDAKLCHHFQDLFMP